MIATPVSYVPTDAWVLYAVIHASKSEPASLAKVIAVGDYYNHAVFTDDELYGGLERLKSGGWVVSKQHTFSISNKCIDIYFGISAKKLSCFDEMKMLAEKLNSDPIPLI
jgi:hypothetical protein